ncbi:unnamed protein product [Darwinula stevensoni]|uniref:Uncharacterized protein n=1 Tax=Darwinula stevensoni TaxID=69355 RepID=A0A7R8X475_9CRUS|nr:unnamed protein product [Darwinula stevensoni]CAG0885738.1 unnamed protein product [Darwinula stevensoni]
MAGFLSNLQQYVTNSVASLNLNLSPRRFGSSNTSTPGNRAPPPPHVAAAQKATEQAQRIRFLQQQQPPQPGQKVQFNLGETKVNLVSPFSKARKNSMSACGRDATQQLQRELRRTSLVDFQRSNHA